MRDRHCGGVLADVDLTVPEAHKLAVIDPHVSGGVHTDAVVVVAFALPVPVPGYEGVADREVPDHDVPDVLELESAPDDFRAAADTGDGGVPGDGEVRAEGRDGDGPLHEHDRRGGTGDRLGEGVDGTDRDDLAAEAADGAMRDRKSTRLTASPVALSYAVIALQKQTTHKPKRRHL